MPLSPVGLVAAHNPKNHASPPLATAPSDLLAETTRDDVILSSSSSPYLAHKLAVRARFACVSYTIDVKSIEIYGKRVVTNNNKGPSLIGRPIPYSRLETSIYSALVKAFAEKAPKRDAVVPFADCFSYKTYGGKSMLEEETPVISLVLGGGAKWDIYGPNALVKVNKNVLCLASGLYYTNVTIGKPPVVANLVVDVRGSALWFECDTLGYNSTTSTPVPCGSRGCEQTKDKCSTCQAYLKSELTFNNRIATLFNDNVMLSYTSPSSPKLPVRARIACRGYFEGMMSMLPAGTVGILGLGNSSTSFVGSLASSYKIPFKVSLESSTELEDTRRRRRSLCLPSKPGNNPGSVYIGGSPKRKDVTGLLVSTPLISNRETIEHGEDYNYFIDVKSIEVNGKRLSFDHELLKNKTGHWGRTKIKNVIPYTLLEASIYNALVTAFSEKAKKLKAVYPFTDCFSYKSFGGKSLLGKETPVISLVLGGGAKWDIYGPNSLVKVKKNVVCLAFQEADEFESKFPIEIGGYQMEDNLVEFDLEASKFSFTSSLLRHNTSCSQL
ncbi:hypothetical protein Bca4012_068972 [Brassica carinata]